VCAKKPCDKNDLTFVVILFNIDIYKTEYIYKRAIEQYIRG